MAGLGRWRNYLGFPAGRIPANIGNWTFIKRLRE